LLVITEIFILASIVISVVWHCWFGGRKHIWPVKAGCWFVDGNILTGALHALEVQLLPPPPSPLAPIQSRMETFWYQLTQVHLENAVKTERENVVFKVCYSCSVSCL